MKYILLLLFGIITLSCFNSNNKMNIIKADEIEPNDSLEYSQFIDSSVSVNASFDETDDYYQINPTNAVSMDFYIAVYDSKANVDLEIFSSNRTLFHINTGDISDYKSVIQLKDIMLYYDVYFLKLNSDKECKYNLKFVFKYENLPINELESNNTVNEADTINYPNEIIYGYFIKNDFVIDERIKPYIKNSPLIDIDIYKISNGTDIDSSINIKLEYLLDDIDVILFDSNLNYIKKGVNQLSTSFEPGKEYYIALICYGEKYITDRYSLYYYFN